MNKKRKTYHTTTTSNEIGARLVLKVPVFGARYGVAGRTVWRWLQLGLPHYKIGKRNTRIPVIEADQWMRENFYRQREG